METAEIQNWLIFANLVITTIVTICLQVKSNNNNKKDTLDQQLIEADLFNEYCNNHNLDKSLFLELIKKNGYALTNDEWDVPSQAKYMINRDIDDNIIPYLCEAIHLRAISMPYKP